MAQTTNFKPPIKIYQVLHEAEAAGVEIPKEIDRWWTKETEENQRQVKEDAKWWAAIHGKKTKVIP